MLGPHFVRGRFVFAFLRGISLFPFCGGFFYVAGVFCFTFAGLSFVSGVAIFFPIFENGFGHTFCDPHPFFCVGGIWVVFSFLCLGFV